MYNCVGNRNLENVNPKKKKIGKKEQFQIDLMSALTEATENSFRKLFASLDRRRSYYRIIKAQKASPFENNSEVEKGLQKVFKSVEKQSLYFDQLIPSIQKYTREKNHQMIQLGQSSLSKQYQKSCNSTLRFRMVRKVFDISSQNKLKKQTIFATFNIFDRYSWNNHTKRPGQQDITGVASLWIACKLIQYHPPGLDKLRTGNLESQIIKQQRKILMKIGFELDYQTVIYEIDTYLNKYDFAKQFVDFCYYTLYCVLFDMAIFELSSMNELALATLKLSSDLTNIALPQSLKDQIEGNSLVDDLYRQIKVQTLNLQIESLKFVNKYHKSQGGLDFEQMVINNLQFRKQPKKQQK